MSLGLKIRQIRTAKGIKQEELASFLKIAQGTLSKIENDISPVLASDLVKIAEYLQTPVTDFLICLCQQQSSLIKTDLFSSSSQQGSLEKITLLEKRIFDLEEWIKDLRKYNAQLREALASSNKKTRILKSDFAE